MRSRGGGSAHGPVAEQIRIRFGSFERFAQEFRETAHEHFGSGWIWLVWREETLPNWLALVRLFSCRTTLTA